MVTLASKVIDRALKGIRLYDQPDILKTAITGDTDTTIEYEGILSGWGPTTVVEMKNELMLVKSVDFGNLIATVERGWLGTTKETTAAAGTPLYLNPRLIRSDLLDLMNDCLFDLIGHDLYQTATLEFNYAAGSIGYNLDVSLLKVLRVDALKDANAGFWEPVYDWHYMDNADTADFASGKALMLRVALPLGAVVRVVYAKDFTQLTAETEDLEAIVGLAPYMTDLPFYFLMNRMMVDEERRRSQMDAAQNHQRAQDTPPFLALRTGEWYQARYLDRIRSSRHRLRQDAKVPMGVGYGS